jgi:hypothetical protein
MSLTAIVTNHNYSGYLPECLESAIRYCDKVVVFDDGSTDASMDIINHYGLKVFHRDTASGGPVEGSNWGIRNTETSHLMFLDADNFLTERPPTNDVDYTFANIDIVNERGWIIDQWRYDNRPTDAVECIRFFIRSLQMPVPWGGVWRTDFLKGKQWRQWPSTRMAPDMLTALDWLQDSPSIAYQPTPFLAFRVHEGQMTGIDERALLDADALEEACRLSASFGATPPCRGSGG